MPAKSEPDQRLRRVTGMPGSDHDQGFRYGMSLIHDYGVQGICRDEGHDMWERMDRLPAKSAEWYAGLRDALHDPKIPRCQIDVFRAEKLP